MAYYSLNALDIAIKQHMKHFTEREKRIINGILHGVTSDSYVLTNAFMDILDRKGISFDCQSRCLLFDKGRNYNIAEMLQFERDFIETALLIQYLIDNEYIYIIKDNDEPPLQIIGEKGARPIGKEIPKEIAGIFILSQNRIVALNKLWDLVSNNFLTYEGQQLHIAQRQLDIATGSLQEAHKQTKSARRTLCWSIVTCFIAILTLLANLFVPSCSKCKVAKNIETITESTQNTSEIDATAINTRLDLINSNILQLVEFSANFNNNFKIQPKIHINPRKKSNSRKAVEPTQKKCSSVQPILKIDTINCDGETYWVLPCPPKKTSTIEEKEK